MSIEGDRLKQGGWRVEGDWERDGAVCVRQAFTPEQVALGVRAIEANLTSLSPLSQRASSPDDGAFIEDFRSWDRLPEIEKFIRETPGAEIAGKLTCSTEIRLYHDHLLVKEPWTTQATPWHQDQPYYNVDGTQNASMWFPVDPVPRSATLEFIAGSHRGPWLMPRTFLNAQAKWFPEGSLAEMPDFAADPEKWPVISWELEPGDAVFFHMLTVHGSRGVDGPNPRRVLSVRYLGDDMVHAPRTWTTSPPFPELDAQLAPGARLDHPLFPVLWTEPNSI